MALRLQSLETPALDKRLFATCELGRLSKYLYRFVYVFLQWYIDAGEFKKKRVLENLFFQYIP